MNGLHKPDPNIVGATAFARGKVFHGCPNALFLALIGVIFGGVFTYHSGWVYFKRGPTKEKQDEGLALQRTGLVEQAKQGEKLDKLVNGANARVSQTNIYGNASRDEQPDIELYMGSLKLTNGMTLDLRATRTLPLFVNNVSLRTFGPVTLGFATQSKITRQTFSQSTGTQTQIIEASWDRVSPIR